MYSSAPIQVLLVEDSPVEAYLTSKGLHEGRVAKQVTVVEDGAEVIPYVRREGKHQQAKLPDLILLDLHLPGKDGLEVLEELKRDPALQRIPVVVLTTSDSEQDIETAYRLGASCFITRPAGFSDYLNMMHWIEDFWLPRESSARDTLASPADCQTKTADSGT
jgi:two-component system response regulator